MIRVIEGDTRSLDCSSMWSPHTSRGSFSGGLADGWWGNVEAFVRV